MKIFKLFFKYILFRNIFKENIRKDLINVLPVYNILR